MRARLTKMGAALAVLAALALGGSALATAAHKTTPRAPLERLAPGQRRKAAGQRPLVGTSLFAIARMSSPPPLRRREPAECSENPKGAFPIYSAGL